MASSRIYKLDNGKPYLNNCFPAKNLLRMPDEGRGHWLVARKCNLKKKPKSVFEAPAEGQESQKKVSSEVRGKKAFQQENQEGIPGHVLDRAFLLKHHCVRKPSDLVNINVSGLKFSKAKEKDFRHFHSVIYINASENLLPLEVVFSSYPGFSTSEATKVCALPPIFEILPVKSLKARNQTLAPPFPELRYLSLAYNKIAKEDAILPVALFPSLCELIFHNNPLVAHTRGMVPTNLRPHPGAQGQCGHPQPHLMDAEPLGSAVGHGWTWFMVHLGTERTTDVADHLPCTSLPDSNLVRWASLSPCSVKDAADQGGVPPLLKSFLQERLGIHLISKKIVKAKHHILMPRKDSRKVKTQVPKVPKRPLILHHLPVTTVQSPSKEIPESEAWPTKELSAARSSILESQIPIEGVEGLSLSHRTFVPLPPICSDSTVYSEETMSHRSNRPGHLSPEHLSDEDTRSMESIFLTQVGELPSSILQRDDSSMKEEEQRPPHTAPREVKRAWRKLPTASLPSKYHGYEELLTAKPDPAFIEPKGIQKNAQALQRMLKCPLLCCSSKPRLGALQKHYIPKEKRAQRIPVPPPRKTRAQLLDDLLVRMRDPQNITEAPLGAVLHQRTERRLVNQKQYLEAKRLLKEFQARYRQLVRYSLRTVFRATAPPPGRPALSEGQPRFGRFLEFMDEFCQEPMASDSKS
ncbi:X-ray radiation resistance-associated protein 1 isoform X5 [Callorhinus ursinus]|uniref:X-ray radiation resistance-associated protein 1 isoform X7 n=1 Tax=Callorhinus ursinus TaxID=34884 RepID=A0A3Q7S819_CALUR|nr:X-ray radiation resistance-associated protein 1 isoform X7 [Callorhinus ursinus]